MNEPASDQTSDMSPRMHRGVRRLWIAFAVVFSLLMAAAVWTDQVVLAPGRAARNLEQKLRSLANHRPSNLTQQEWSSAASWTVSLHRNSLIHSQATAAEIRDLDRRMTEQLSGQVDLSTIHWIWDEYAKVCPGGANYQRFREHMLAEITSASAQRNINMH